MSTPTPCASVSGGDDIEFHVQEQVLVSLDHSRVGNSRRGQHSDLASPGPIHSLYLWVPCWAPRAQAEFPCYCREERRSSQNIVECSAITHSWVTGCQSVVLLLVLTSRVEASTLARMSLVFACDAWNRHTLRCQSIPAISLSFCTNSPCNQDLV